MPALEPNPRQQGQTRPLKIVKATDRQLSIILREAAREAEAIVLEISRRPTFSAAIRTAQLEQYIAAFEPMSRRLWNGVDAETRAGMYLEGDLAALQALERDLLIGMPQSLVETYRSAVQINARIGVEAVISRGVNGIPLSERILRNGVQSLKQLEKIINRELALQSSARRIASLVKSFYAPNVPGGASYAAFRLARTEINNAHLTTTYRLADNRPWVLGYKWFLSGSHPRADPCDDLANQDAHGLGAGIYPKDATPSRPHPQCLCYVGVVQLEEQEFMDNLLAGRYDDWFAQSGGIAA